MCMFTYFSIQFIGTILKWIVLIFYFWKFTDNQQVFGTVWNYMFLFIEYYSISIEYYPGGYMNNLIYIIIFIANWNSDNWVLKILYYY